MRRKVHLFLTILACIFILLELFLRLHYGFCNALLYLSSDKYEYIAQPNQNRCRFGARILSNSYSQRNEEPYSTRIKILGLGDSVLFGGTWMDQDSLGSTIFSQETGMQMLNISAGSWGPDNCAAYLKEKGTFDAKAMLLVCSSHDAYDVMSFFPVVGKFPSYPDKQYKLAIIELWERYIQPRIKFFYTQQKAKLDPDAAVVEKAETQSVAKKSPLFNKGFDQLKVIADSLNIPFGIYLHAETSELEKGDYNAMGQQICKWAEENEVPITLGLFTGETKDMYKDIIHLNEKGQKHLARMMEKIIRELLTDNEEDKKNSNTPA